MKVRILKSEGFLVAGLKSIISESMTTGHNSISKLWDRFLEEIDDIPGVSNGNIIFGISMDCLNSYDGKFKYMVCREVDGKYLVPDNMAYLNIPPMIYAIFPHTKGLDRLDETFGYIFDVWMPASGYTHDGGIIDSIEVYELDPVTAKPNILYLYVPVAGKTGCTTIG